KRVAAPVTMAVSGAGSAGSGWYDSEVTALSWNFGDGVMIRESPTLASRGAIQLTPQTNGTYGLNFFFDLFTELSLDGGATWAPATNGPARTELTTPAPEVVKPSANLPSADGKYTGPPQWFALYANGVIVTNVTVNNFTQSLPPPPPGGNQT